MIEDLFWLAYGVPGASVDVAGFLPHERDQWLQLLIAQKKREADAVARKGRGKTGASRDRPRG